MADKVTLASIASFQNDTTAAAAYNNNNALITTAMDNTLSRDGTLPNQMGSNLDMNNNQILNLPAPATVNSPARLVDVVTNPTITVPPTGTSGAVVPLLNANNNTFSGTGTSFNLPALTAIANATNSSAQSTNVALSTLSGAVNPVWYGADPTGVSDSTAALNSALAASKIVIFPAGKFLFNSPITFSLGASAPTSLTIAGSGQDVTILYWPSGNGLTVNYQNQQQSVHIRDLSFTTGATASNIGLQLTQQGGVAGGANMGFSDITRVTFRGDDGYQLTKFWTTAIQSTGISSLNLDTVFVAGPSVANGNGIVYKGLTSIPAYAVVLNVDKCVFNNLLAGLVYADYVQGVTVSQTNFTGCVNGITSSGSELGSLSQLAVTGSQFGQFAAGNSVITNTTVNQVILIGNTFIITAGSFSASSVFLPIASDYTIVGNVFTGAGGVNSNGVVIGTLTASTAGNISNNFIGGYNNGILLQAGSNNITISGNRLISNTNPIANSGTGTNIIIRDNFGYNPVGVSAAITMGASPFTYTAGSSPETHYVNQSATNTATIAKGTRQIATLAGATTYYTVELGPNESYVTTWATTAPTYTKDIH